MDLDRLSTPDRTEKQAPWRIGNSGSMVFRGMKAALEALQPGESATTEDYYAIPVHAKLRSKLYYASAYSTLTSTGNFKLYCDDEGNVDIDGTVWHEWTDRYDWQEGEYAAFKVLNREFVIPDDAAIRLVNAGDADNFDMFSMWQEGVEWFVSSEAR